ncbi:hypothetical protein CRI93_03900 [Longimonas halophila]|uniref:Uncharacterized protein n=1 Tax=Longimonas halophila TaxID=1469170 RepID=A0A2H3NNE7_9BACT|nr:hypothetical protein CRI93_03900 [Longimonas halophila]
MIQSETAQLKALRKYPCHVVAAVRPRGEIVFLMTQAVPVAQMGMNRVEEITTQTAQRSIHLPDQTASRSPPVKATPRRSTVTMRRMTLPLARK